jgi:ABC-type transport system involved in cytochrome bd biosynthesis fused ATPase/permease subunit
LEKLDSSRAVTPAQKHFIAMRDEDEASTRIWEALEAAGIAHEEFSCDGYDESIELRGSTLSELTEQQQSVLWTLGYSRAWLHGSAGEKYYTAPVRAENAV